MASCHGHPSPPQIKERGYISCNWERAHLRYDPERPPVQRPLAPRAVGAFMTPLRGPFGVPLRAPMPPLQCLSRPFSCPTPNQFFQPDVPRCDFSFFQRPPSKFMSLKLVTFVHLMFSFFAAIPTPPRIGTPPLPPPQGYGGLAARPPRPTAAPGFMYQRGVV